MACDNELYLVMNTETSVSSEITLDFFVSAL